MFLAVHSTKNVTSPKDVLRQRWLPEVEPAAVSKPAANVVKWLQTSARPGYGGPTLKSELISVEDSDQLPSSIKPLSNERALFNGVDGAADSTWPDNYQQRPQNNSAELLPAHSINSASDANDGDFFLNKTHGQKNIAS